MARSVLAGVATAVAMVAATALPAQRPAPATAPESTRSGHGAPRLGTWGFDESGMDRTVTPGDSFFDFANGAWARRTEIPPDRSSWGVLGELGDLTQSRIRRLIESAAASKAPTGTNQRKVGDYFASFMDEQAIERRGVAPLRPYLARIASIRSRNDLARILGEINQLGVDSPFRIAVEQDLKDNSRYQIYVRQGGLGLPDRDYYRADGNARFVELRSQYRRHIAAMLRLAGLPDPEARAGRIYDLERKIAEGQWSKAELRDIERSYNPRSRAELARTMPDLDWQAYLRAAGLGRRSIIVVTAPSALEAATKLIRSEALQTWKDYLTFRVIAAASPWLPRAFVDESFAFNGHVLQDTPRLAERWRRGIDLVNRHMGEAVGQMYVAAFFSPAAKTKAIELTRNLVAALDNRLARLEWMAPATKVKARAKLRRLRAKIGYPDKWRDYSALKIKRGDALGNAFRAERFEYRRNLLRLGGPVDRGEWALLPQSVNAFANPPLNEIIFPAAILQPPFFDPAADDAVNYGAIGTIIAHEITHHFDDQGRKFDPDGNLAEWWDPSDVASFERLARELVKQYGAYEPLAGTRVNGELTLGENIADLGGLAVAYDAYRMSLGGKPAATLAGFTGDQRFFLGFAQMWRIKYRDAALRQYLATNSHTPGHFRLNVVRNIPSWYDAFRVTDGRLFLPPSQRVTIW